ncbi:MAG: hypothetical protein K9H49_08405 [Bacteroidales bacterium]|nr:hypothetical protein [Bacteroidales bacterium]MCF8404729.1 hypothetical protein [Bacteroidales bacterium]
MTIESKIYAKQQQIKLIDNILCSLCSIELTSEGRKYLKKMKERIENDLAILQEINFNNDSESGGPKQGFKLKFPEALKVQW